MRLQVVVGKDRVIVPVAEDATVGWLMDEAQRRANATGATHVVLSNGFRLCLTDKIKDVAENNEILTVCNLGQDQRNDPVQLPVERVSAVRKRPAHTALPPLGGSAERPRKAKKILSLQEKFDVLGKLDEGASHTDIANEYGLHLSTVSKLIRCRDTLEAARDRGTDMNRHSVRGATYPQLEKTVRDWVVLCRELHMHVSTTAIQDKARSVAAEMGIETFKASNGWLQKFMQRYKLGPSHAPQMQVVQPPQQGQGGMSAMGGGMGGVGVGMGGRSG